MVLYSGWYDSTILGLKMISNMKTEMSDFKERVLIGWLANTVRVPANEDAYLKVQHFCFYVKVFMLRFLC